jgi:hypothetical protein
MLSKFMNDPELASDWFGAVAVVSRQSAHLRQLARSRSFQIRPTAS